MRFNYLLLVVFVLKFASSGIAQDIHFTQWMHAPHTYSPSSIGDFVGKHRVIANYKRQWASVTVPFTTFAASIDSRQFTSYEKLGLGFSILHDRTGDSKFSTTVINSGGSWKFSLGDSIGYVIGSIQPSLTQKRIDLADLNFDEQYNGFYFDNTISNTENLPKLSRWYFDMAIGVKLKYNINSKTNLKIGLGVFNLLKPKQSFFDNDEIRLDRKYLITSQLSYKLNKKITVYPGLMASIQGQFNSINFGGLVDCDLAQVKNQKQSVFAGVYFRTVDSGDIIAGLNYDQWRFGVSYDINYSGLNPASNYRGGLELAIIYIIANPKKRPRFRTCPDYL